MAIPESAHRSDSHSNDAEVRYSKEDALTDREFILLLEGAREMRDYYGQQTLFAILVLGRLGLRRGELAHLRESWIDWRSKMIQIPLQQDCHKAREGDGICGACKQIAAGKARTDTQNYIDDVYESDLDRHEPGVHVRPEEFVQPEDNYEVMWEAKTDAAARNVYFGFDARVELFVNRFFDEYDRWPFAPASINRRVKKAAEHAEELTREDVRPHSLRATAATYHAGSGLKTQGLTQHFGWADMSTGNRYVARSAKRTARRLDSIHQG